MIKKVQEKIKNLFFVTLLFSAAISFAQPTATSATDVASDGFTANWDSFTGSTGYYLDISESPTFGEGQYASNLIISEYGEGSGGSKKYVEIFNGTGATVDLANYKIWVISNGGNWPESQITLSGTLANGDAYVIANNSTDVYNADMYTGSLSHNGDDAIGLAWNGGSGPDFNVIDAVGTDGADPGTGWSVAGVADATKDKILIRKSSVFDPTMDWAASAGTNAGNSQWIVSSFTYDTVTQTTDLGSHTFDGGFVPSLVTGFDGLDVGNVTSYMVTGLEPETTYYYRVRSYDGVDVTDNSNVIQVITTASACGTVDLPTAEAQMLCSGDATVANLTVTTGDMPQWYAAETGGTALIPETVVTTGTYYVSQTVGVCESERVAVEVSVIGAPEANAQLFCGSATVADLTVTIGENIQWYDVATGGTPLTDDTALATATYYVSQLGDSCESERTMVEVTINDIPAAPTAETVQEFCGSATLANVVVTGDNITWYDTPAGGLEVAADMVLTGGTHLYYAAQTVNGCESADRIAIAITVNVTPVPEVENLTLCGDSTVADLTVVSGTDVKWYNAAVGGNLLTADAAIVTGTYYATQTVDGCESERTAVIVTINPLPVSPTADAQAFCGSATVADLTAEGTNILETIFNDNFNNLNNWSAISLQGSNGWAISSNGNPANAPYVMLNGYQQNNLDWLVSNPIAVPANALSTTLSFITASNYNGPTLQVYYTTNYTGDVATTDWQTLSPTLSSGSWAWVNSGNLDVSDAAGSDLVIAYKYTSSTGSNNAKAWEIDNVKVNIEYQDLHWYDMIGNELAETDALSSGTYHVTQTIDGCESESTEVDVTVNPIPAAPIADAQMFCGTATIADIMVTVDGTAAWYADAATTTPLASDTALTTTAYYVSQTINGCEGERTMVEVTVNEIPAAPVADAQTFCGLTTVADLTATGENLMWYDVETGGVALLEGLVAATGTYYVSQTVNGCESPRTMVDVTVNEIPVAPLADAQMFCGTATVADLAVNMGENVMWYDVETGGTALAADAALATGTYYVSQTVNGCESPRAMVAVTVNEIPAAPTADAQLFCGSATVADIAVTGDMPMWYDVETGGTALTMDAALATGMYYVSQTVNGCESARTAVSVTVNEIPAVPTADAQLFCGSATAAELMATTEGAAIWYADATTAETLPIDTDLTTGLYYVSQIVNGCESPRIAVSVTVNPIPDAPIADAQTFCGSAVASELMATTEGAAIWYADETTMTPLAADAELATADYYVSQIVNGCESARTMVEVTINEIPVAPTADNFTFCGSATVADLSVITGEMPMWYTTETGGDALSMDAALATGMYYVSQTVNGCESVRTMVDVTVNEIPAVPTAEGLQTFCTEATIASIAITGENITWYDAVESGSIVATDMALTEGTSIYYASQTVNGCESARTAVAVVLNITAVPTAEDLAYCGSTTVADLTATGENLMWYDVENEGTALAADAVVATGTYYVSQTVNGCESSRVAVNVAVTEVAMPTGEATQEFTAGETIADLEVDGTNVIWFSDAELTVIIETTTELTDGTTYYAVANNGDCASEALAVTAEEVLKTAVIADAKFTHYPNPVEDVLNIEYKENITSVTVYNVIGQLVLERNTNGNNVQVNMSTLSAGTYIVRVASDNKSTSFKVVKN